MSRQATPSSSLSLRQTQISPTAMRCKLHARWTLRACAPLASSPRHVMWILLLHIKSRLFVLALLYSRFDPPPPVLTHVQVDIMDRGTNAMDMLSNKIVPLRLGYIAVVNRGQVCVCAWCSDVMSVLN